MIIKQYTHITLGQMLEAAEKELDALLLELKLSILAGDIDKRHKTLQEILKRSGSINNLLTSAKKVKQ